MQVTFLSRNGVRRAAGVTVLILAAALLSVCAVPPSAGSGSGNLEWDLSDGVLTISGTGAVPAYADWYQSRADVETLVIQEGITSLNTNAFSGFENLKKAVLPDTVASVGGYAFYKCGKLASVSMNGVREIDIFAFAETGLSSVDIPGCLERINNTAFDGTAIRCVVIPSGCTIVDDSQYSSHERVLFLREHGIDPVVALTVAVTIILVGTAAAAILVIRQRRSYVG